MNRRPEVQIEDKRAMEQASRLYKPPFLDIEEIRRKEKTKKRGRVN